MQSIAEFSVLSIEAKINCHVLVTFNEIVANVIADGVPSTSNSKMSPAEIDVVHPVNVLLCAFCALEIAGVALAVMLVVVG